MCYSSRLHFQRKRKPQEFKQGCPHRKEVLEQLSKQLCRRLVRAAPWYGDLQNAPADSIGRKYNSSIASIPVQTLVRPVLRLMLRAAQSQSPLGFMRRSEARPHREPGASASSKSHQIQSELTRRISVQLARHYQRDSVQQLLIWL